MTGRIANSLGAGALLAMLLLGAFAPAAMAKDKKDKKNQPPAAPTMPEPKIDTSKLVWPKPPDIARVKYVASLAGEKPEAPAAQPKKNKHGWMDRLAGIQTTDVTVVPQAHVLAKPYGVAVDSKGKIYVADSYVGAVFIFDPETDKVEFIRNGIEARFKTIIGLAIDDGDRLFVSDAALHQVSVFDKTHKLLQVFGGTDLERPSGMAIDNENRFLYVVDTGKQHVVVYDADSFKLLRTIGGPPKIEADDSPETFALPTNIAVDTDGNVYVSDTLNNRIQIFDAEGKFISMFGKEGDGPGTFERPKGIAVDVDGHIWVVDAAQNRVQVFDQEGHLLAYFGEPGKLPGQFGLPAGLFIDKQNRVIVTEQLKGRAQIFRYVPDSEVAAQKSVAAK
jgi:DNA-binding beta-propeller fold protein YncE